MSRLHLLIASLFAVALGTGIVVGMDIRGMSLTHAALPPHDGHSWLADQLQLSPEQSEQMKTIWSELLKGAGQRHADARKQYQKEREDAVKALLTLDQKAAYDKIQENYSNELTELSRERDAEFQAAADRTKQVLNDHQRQIYEDLLKKGIHGGPWGPPHDPQSGPPGMHPEGGHDRGRRETTSTSQPGPI